MNIDTEDGDDYLRLRALVKWRVIIESDLEACEVGLQLTELVNDLKAEALIRSTISDIFAKKSTATMLKRSSAILRYLQWAKKQALERPTLFPEIIVYAYVCFLRDSFAKPTVAVAFLEAMNFCIHTCGYIHAIPASKSQRIKGAASSQFRLKRVLKQAPALKVCAMRILENACNESPTPLILLIQGR